MLNKYLLLIKMMSFITFFRNNFVPTEITHVLQGNVDSSNCTSLHLLTIPKYIDCSGAEGISKFKEARRQVEDGQQSDP